ncbi:MAG TPA: CPBP family intramembrane glutamic endopeptidase, partial [Clostridiaceae bacterium]|nr:CPBP family intramembrane glutamic endopeptidase [Clostridiaceae bacterium]
GITFGLGHIVNLMRGYGYAEQVGQIVVAVAIGITLALIVARTRNIVPGILFHILFNISGSVTRQETGMETMLAVAIVVLSLGYALYLSKSIRHPGETGSFRHTSAT